jgi:hypothetical protein
MKLFYLLRHIDVHSNSGVGIVGEGVVFDSGMAVLTWLTDIPTVTTFKCVTDVKRLHGHEGKTEIVIQGKHLKFDFCQEQAKIKKDIQDREEMNGKGKKRSKPRVFRNSGTIID